MFKAFTAPPLTIAPDTSTLALVIAAYLLLAPEDQNSMHAAHGGQAAQQPLPRIVVLLHAMSMHVAEVLAGVELMEHELAASSHVAVANQVGIARRECEGLLTPVATPAGGVEWLGRHASLGQCMAQLLQALQGILDSAHCMEIVSRITMHCASEVRRCRLPTRACAQLPMLYRMCGAACMGCSVTVLLPALGRLCCLATTAAGAHGMA